MDNFNFTKKEPITKGWSGDKKYCVTSTDGSNYLLRVSPMEQYDTKKSEFEMMRRVAALGVPMCQPIEFGTCDEGVYSIQSWIDGKDAEEIIYTLSDTEQYTYGLEAGRILKQIHSIPAPPTQEDWKVRFNRKTDIMIQKYHKAGIRVDGDDKIIEYIDNNRHLIEKRLSCFCHGDYHAGNIMIKNNKLVIIDFERFDFGDPWWDFHPAFWDGEKSPCFFTGIIKGYFQGRLSESFFDTLIYYFAYDVLIGMQREPKNEKWIRNNINCWKNAMQNPVPSWYSLPQFCFCGHDCSRCVTYLATVNDNDSLRKQSQQFYKDFMNREIPLCDIKCHGGRSDDVFCLCEGCPFMKCCKEKGISACSECEKQCEMFLDYQMNVNKYNQL